MFWRGGKEPGPGNEQTLTDLVTRVLRLFFPVEPDHELNRLKQENIRLKHQNERLRYHFYHSMRDLGAAEPGDYPEAQRP